MKIVKLLSLALIVTAYLFAVSCKKASAGATGATGATGSTGADSIYYGSVTLNMVGGWDSVGDSVEIDTIAAAAVTSSIASQGLVAGYIYFPTQTGDTAWISVNNEYWFGFEQILRPGSIILVDWWGYDPSTQNWPDPTDYTGYKYRYVILPGNVSVSDANGQKQTITAAQLKKMDYSTLMSTLKSAGVSVKTATN